MVKLLVIADDFTGALDTGIQFINKGIETQVIIGEEINKDTLSPSADVLVIDSETRPMNPEQANKVIRRIVRDSKDLGIKVIYKKTDSALRGNLGSELSAVLDESNGDKLYFIPAFPMINRTTKNGTQYIGGFKLEDSGFGRDPFDPMTCSYIPDILAKQTDKKVKVIERNQSLEEADIDDSNIIIFDAETSDDIESRIKELKDLKHEDKPILLAGCAGFANFLPEALGLQGNVKEEPFKTENFVVACGSVNPISKKQVEKAEKEGFYRRNLIPEEKLNPSFYESEEGLKLIDELADELNLRKRLELDTFDLDGCESVLEYSARTGFDPNDIRFAISESYGKIVKNLIEKGIDMTILMTGGDTLMGLMKEIGVNQISPVKEVAQGTVLSWLFWDDKTIQVVSKSGGYGDEDVFVKVSDQVLIQ